MTPTNPIPGHIYDPDGNDLGLSPATTGIGNAWYQQQYTPGGHIQTNSYGWGRGAPEVNAASAQGYTLDPNTGQWIAPSGTNTDPYGGPLLAAIQAASYSTPQQYQGSSYGYAQPGYTQPQVQAAQQPSQTATQAQSNLNASFYAPGLPPPPLTPIAGYKEPGPAWEGQYTQYTNNPAPAPNSQAYWGNNYNNYLQNGADAVNAQYAQNRGYKAGVMNGTPQQGAQGGQPNTMYGNPTGTNQTGSSPLSNSLSKMLS